MTSWQEFHQYALENGGMDEHEPPMRPNRDDDDVRIIRDAIEEIERHTGWRSDAYDEEPYPATDDDYRRVVLASDLHKLAERLAAREART